MMTIERYYGSRFSWIISTWLKSGDEWQCMSSTRILKASNMLKAVARVADRADYIIKVR